jgi:hypothetical protein
LVPILENDSYFSQYYSKLGSKGLKSRAKPTPSSGSLRFHLGKLSSSFPVLR